MGVVYCKCKRLRSLLFLLQEGSKMPKTKTQRIVFGILMSFFMAYGMEVYNIAIRMGYNLTVGQGFSGVSRSTEGSSGDERDCFYRLQFGRQSGRGRLYGKILCPRQG